MSTTDKRKFARWQLVYSLRVFETETDALIGYLADISDSGMSLVTEKSFKLGKRTFLWMEVRLQTGEVVRVDLEAESRWADQNKDTGLYHVGFELSEIDPLLVVSIRCIVDELTLEA